MSYRDKKGQFMKENKLTQKHLETLECSKISSLGLNLKKDILCLNCKNVFVDYVSNKRKFCSKHCSALVTKNALGNKHTKETKIKISKASLVRFLDKTNHPRYKKDRTQLVKRQERNDGSYKEWRRSVWLRDNFKCKIANPDCKGRLEAHHILGWSSHPELRYQINNGITLCHTHHPRKRVEEKRLSPYFQELVSVSKE